MNRATGDLKLFKFIKKIKELIIGKWDTPTAATVENDVITDEYTRNRIDNKMPINVDGVIYYYTSTYTPQIYYISARNRTIFVLGIATGDYGTTKYSVIYYTNNIVEFTSSNIDFSTDYTNKLKHSTINLGKPILYRISNYNTIILTLKSETTYVRVYRGDYYEYDPVTQKHFLRHLEVTFTINLTDKLITVTSETTSFELTLYTPAQTLSMSPSFLNNIPHEIEEPEIMEINNEHEEPEIMEINNEPEEIDEIQSTDSNETPRGSGLVDGGTYVTKGDYSDEEGDEL